MGLDKDKFLGLSLKQLEDVFTTTDIYLVDNLNVYHLVNKHGTFKSPRKLSLAWLFDRNGFLTSLDRYDTYAKRVAEYVTTGDYIKRFRQRLAMIHEMISCNFTPNLPLHISIRPSVKITSELTQPVFDIEDRTMSEYFDIEIHPGQTRAQAGIFLREKLNNNLLYISKRYKKDFELKMYPNIKKIETLEQLLQVYKPSFRVHSQQLYKQVKDQIKYNFCLSNAIHPEKRPVKYHRSTGTSILKCVDMGIPDLNSSRMSISFHSTSHYIPDTFMYMDKFCDILFNSPVNVYTDDPELAYSIHNAGGNYTIFGEVLEKKEMRQHTFTQVRGVFIDETGERPKPPHPITPESLGYLNKILPLKKFTDFTHINSTLQSIGTESFFNFNINYKQVAKEDLVPNKYIQLVEKNSFKGYCIVFDCDATQFYRNVYELLLLVPADFTLAKSENNKVAILNCEHEFWKTKSNYREFIFNDSFYDMSTI